MALPGDCDVQGYIQSHYTPYYGDESFLSEPTPRTVKAFQRFQYLYGKKKVISNFLNELEKIKIIHEK